MCPSQNPSTDIAHGMTLAVAESYYSSYDDLMSAAFVSEYQLYLQMMLHSCAVIIHAMHSRFTQVPHCGLRSGCGTIASMPRCTL